jgi:serine/threonine-protein kinase
MPLEITDNQFYDAAKRIGLLNDEQIEAISKIQTEAATKGFAMKASKIAVMKGMLTALQAERIEKDAAPQTEKFARFELLDKIRDDAQGTIYKAVHAHNTKLVVQLKIMDEKLFSDPECMGRFLRAADILRETKHPNIVHALEKGEFEGRPYIVLEYNDGKLLSEILEELGCIDEASALKIGLEIASALELMNKRGLIHRDIKPDTILITQAGMAKLTDLGLAKFASNELKQVTIRSTPIGTPAYMAPEYIMEQKDLDIRTDIYGLGATLFHAVTGKLPYESNNIVQVMQMINSPKTPDASSLRAEVSPHMSALLKGMMAKDRAKRYSAKLDDLMDDMRRVSKGQPPKFAKS